MNKRQTKKFKKKLGYKSYKNANRSWTFGKFFKRALEVTYDRSEMDKAMNAWIKLKETVSFMSANVESTIYSQPVILEEFRGEFK